MTERLQPFGFRDSSYERVEQPWRCGRTGGEPCPLGPDRGGRCRGRYACMPVAGAEAGTFRCARPKDLGGACAAGPSADGVCCIEQPPCQPVHSLRARRGLVVRMTFALTLGVLLLMLFGPARDDFVDPGDLSEAHHRLGLACTACHGAAGESAADWLTWASQGDTSADMAARCRVCHDFADHGVPQNPHGLPLAHLRAQREARGSSSEAGLEPRACGACHREHQGRDRRLVPSTDADCAGCHVERFSSFEHGHPPFAALWPHERRNPVAFDHEAHYRGLFAQGISNLNAPEGVWSEPRCTVCHQPHDQAAEMRPRFEEHCQACHDRPMRFGGESADDVALRFVQFPWFDGAMAPEGWPEDFGMQDPSEIVISSEMQILLGRDREAYTRLMARLPEEDRSPEGFYGLEAEAKEDVSAFLLALRRVLEDLGKPEAERAAVLGALAARLEASLGAAPAPADLERLWPLDLQRRAAEALRRWMQPDAGSDPPEAEAASAFRISEEAFSLDFVPDYETNAPDRTHHHDALVAWTPLVLRFLDRQEPLSGPSVVHRIPPGIARCLKCHNVDREADGRLRVDWTAHERIQREHLDRFLHAPHIGQDLEVAPGRAGLALGWADLPSLKRDPLMLNCLTCHVPTAHHAHDAFFMPPASVRDDAPPAGRTDPFGAPGNFGPIARDLCVTCHVSGHARRDCLTCHVYHAGLRTTRVPAPATGGRPGSR